MSDHISTHSISNIMNENIQKLKTKNNIIHDTPN